MRSYTATFTTAEQRKQLYVKLNTRPVKADYTETPFSGLQITIYDHLLQKTLKRSLAEKPFFLIKSLLYDSFIRKGLSQKSPFSWRKTTDITIS
jgi:hypothetical protein